MGFKEPKQELSRLARASSNNTAIGPLGPINQADLWGTSTQATEPRNLYIASLIEACAAWFFRRPVAEWSGVPNRFDADRYWLSNNEQCEHYRFFKIVEFAK